MKKQFDLRNAASLSVLQIKKIFFLLLLIHLTGCGFQGRKYTLGNYWNNQVADNKALETHEKKKEKDARNGDVKTEETRHSSAVEDVAKSIGKDTLKIPPYQKPSKINPTTIRNNLIAPEQEIQRDESQDINRKEKKLRRAKNGFVTFWSIESLFYLGLLSNAISPDIWGFWLFVFGFLTAFFLFFTLIYLAVMKKRYSKSMDLLKNERLKSKIPKLMRVFIWALLIEVALLMLALAI